MGSENQKVWLLNHWFKGWNSNKTAFAIQSPWNTNGLIWIYKNYYLSSKYKNRFGIEVNIVNFKTKEIHYYQEIIYSLGEKQVNLISGKILANFFEELNNKNSQEYREFVTKFIGEKIYD
ncbi:hypothetical protein [Spiroplasma floricola]|uniref:Uncharacterized protein n=1 Tax=Spiroplasma floricola 23-6 TaxID=1336749 RepID=A0A2K8SF40_9MOLU|nr:hypothetical protein [Spiroplasma floricola]AUB32043.1 hypothetical protein SFLOR_v1c09950 [Spiroplasma floricola 23-6]